MCPTVFSKHKGLVVHYCCLRPANYSVVALNVAKARTGKLPMPLILTGTAVNLKHATGSSWKLQRCSTIGIPAARSAVCTGRAPPEVSSIFSESIPTSTAPCSLRKSAAAPVRNECPLKYWSVAQCFAHPVCTRTALPLTSIGTKVCRSTARPDMPSARTTTASSSARPDRSSSEMSLPS
jgi:hypothetical protein